MCSLNDNKPIRSNTHKLAAELAQHARRMKIPLMTSNFWAKRDFLRVKCVVWPYTWAVLVAILSCVIDSVQFSHSMINLLSSSHNPTVDMQ